jgi:hypothetical protein
VINTPEYSDSTRNECQFIIVRGITCDSPKIRSLAVVASTQIQIRRKEREREGEGERERERERERVEESAV